jgi:hypothetical protein
VTPLQSIGRNNVLDSPMDSITEIKTVRDSQSIEIRGRINELAKLGSQKLSFLLFVPSSDLRARRHPT